jgi:hypothetical protein
MTTVICNGCGGNCRTNLVNSDLPDNGWALPYPSFGYYGGFSDNLGYLLGDNEPQPDFWRLCHDCILAIFSVLPALGKSMSVGQHPCEDDTPCCKWAWKHDEDTSTTLVVGDDGNWRKAVAGEFLS